jgi:hypothetical protein
VAGGADCFGLDDAQAYDGALAPRQLEAMWAAYGAVASMPPPPPARALWPACASVPLVHRYAPAAGAPLPGLLPDAAGGWDAQPLDAGASEAGGAWNGTLSVAAPRGDEPAAGYTLRLLLASAGASAPAWEWQGMSAAPAPGGGLLVANDYDGSFGYAAGVGTEWSPALPYLPGEYATFSFGPDGSAVFAGARAWASFPAVRFARGQGAGARAARVSLGDSRLLDLQVYAAAMTPAQIIAAATGSPC